jgi:hypothetical protein
LVPAVLALLLLWQLLAPPDEKRERVLVLAVLCVIATRVLIAVGGGAGLVLVVLALLLLWQLLAYPGKEGVQRVARIGLLAWTTYCVLHEPLLQRPRPPMASSWEWPAQAATIDAALRARRAGTLQEPEVLGDIRCRPAYSPKWVIRGLTIAPDSGP